MPPWILTLGAGAILGALVGQWGGCNGGTCPLLANWWRGAIYGACLGFVIGISLFGGKS